MSAKIISFPSELQRREDGWPLCPFCGEDELGDLGHTFANVMAELYCYRCARVTVSQGKPVRLPA